MTALPGLSVIVVTHERPELLVDALHSIVHQTLRPLEVRIADDGGGTSLDALPPLPLLELTALVVDCGQAGAARNAAAAGARGDVLVFLDDDDRWTPDHLAGIAPVFADPQVGFAWRDCVIVRERVHAGGSRETLETRRIARDWDDALMRSHDFLPPSAWAVRRSLFESLGGFDESFRYSEDWDLLLRLASATTPVRIPGDTVEIRMRETGNASAEVNPERLACLARLSQRHGLGVLPPMTFWEVAQIVMEHT